MIEMPSTGETMLRKPSLLALIVALLLVPQAPAAAESRRIADAVGDVVMREVSADQRTRAKRIDIRWINAKYTQDRLIVVTKVRDLRRTGWTRHNINVENGVGKSLGYIEWRRGSGAWFMSWEDGPITRISEEAKYGLDRFVMSISAKSLGYPSSVRVSATTELTGGAPGTDAWFQAWDTAPRNSGATSATISRG